MGRESKSLLTGLGRYTVCGANIQIIGGVSGAPGKGKRIYYYECSYHHNRGPTVCSNDHKERMDAFDDAVLETELKRINCELDALIAVVVKGKPPPGGGRDRGPGDPD